MEGRANGVPIQIILPTHFTDREAEAWRGTPALQVTGPALLHAWEVG